MDIHGNKTGGRTKGTLNKATNNLKAAFQKHRAKFVKALLDLTNDEDPNVRLRAVALCLERGWGKAPQPVTGADGDGPVLALIERVIVDERREDAPVQDETPEPLVH